MNKKISDPKEEEIKSIFNYELNTEHLYVTTGKEGATYTNGVEYIKRKSFKTEIIDTIGAGDTFFAFAALCASLDETVPDKLLIPSLSASLSTTWLCNERSITKETLLKHAARYI